MKILDKGEIELIDSMGGDHSVLAAARVSNGVKRAEAQVTPEKDQRLINYLVKHRHGTPFEHTTFQFYVKAPLFVRAEWHRHRMACVTGDTKITCVSPNGTAFKRTIKEIYDLKHGGVVDSLPEDYQGKNKRHRYKVKGRIRVLPNCQNRQMRVLDEETGKFVTGNMKEIWEAGVKSIVHLKLEKGKNLTASLDHQILTKDGWKRLGTITKNDLVAVNGLVPSEDRPIPPSLRNGIGVWTSMMRGRLLRDEDCYICGQFFDREYLVLDHVIPVIQSLALALDVSNLKPACMDCHRLKTNKEQKFRQSKTKLGVQWLKVIDTQLINKEMTYDIEMDAPNHNYVANDIVVHNSYNEISGRYVEYEPEFYIPEALRIAGKTNKQGSQEPEDQYFTDNTGFWSWDRGKGRKIPTTTSEMTNKEYWNYIEKASMEIAYNSSFEKYKLLLSHGVAKEMARMVLPSALYSQWYMTCNARGLMNFLSLRAADDAQWEIRQYAIAMKEMFKEKMPMTYEAWEQNGFIAP